MAIRGYWNKMKYKYVITSGICMILLLGGIGCAAAISHANLAEPAAVQNENEDAYFDGTSAAPRNDVFNGYSAKPGNDVFIGAGIQLVFNGNITESQPDGDEAIAVFSVGAVVAGEDGITTVSEEESEYADFAIANVNNYVNVRTQPSTKGSIVGKIYGGAVAQILSVVDGEDGDWFQIVSGDVEGYIKAEYFLYGDAAVAVIDDYVTRYATVIANRLNVRKEPDIEASRVGYLDNGERVKILENLGDWLKVQYTEETTGYVSAEYVTISEEFIYAKSIEEERREAAERKALQARQKQSEAQAAENTTITVTPPNTSYETTSELRQQIVDYAMQYLGNRYIHGGKTLAGGTDCSGFTSLIYAEFGYSLSRTPAGQLANAGRSVSYSEAQPGDIICYGSSGKCTHVGMYIGDGQIIHSANPRKGVVTQRADFDTILGVKNIVD